MGTLRWGIVSTAGIGMKAVTPAIQQADGCEVVAIASRDGERARAAADRLGIPAAYGSYEVRGSRISSDGKPLDPDGIKLVEATALQPALSAHEEGGLG